MNSNLNNHQGARYGWSTYWLISPIALAPSAIASTSSSIPPSLFSTSDSIKLLIFALTVIGVPLIRSLWSSHNEKVAFKIFLKGHTKNAKDNFGHECSIDHARDHHNASGEWVDLLEGKGLGIPEYLLIINKTIEEYASKVSHDQKVWPFLTYLGVNNDNAPLDHGSIIWKLKKHETKAAANYFISQEQVVTALKTQYETPYFNLIKDGDFHHREQWCKRLKGCLHDLADHYVNIVELRKVLG